MTVREVSVTSAPTMEAYGKYDHSKHQLREVLGVQNMLPVVSTSLQLLKLRSVLQGERGVEGDVGDPRRETAKIRRM